MPTGALGRFTVLDATRVDHAVAGPPRPAPRQGEQTDAILRELGYGQARIAELRARLVV